MGVPASWSEQVTDFIVISGGVEKSVEDDRQYHWCTLPKTGITVLCVCDPRAEQRAAAAMCVADAGARTAPESLPGLAHFLEHMLVRLANRPDEPANWSPPACLLSTPQFLGSAKYPDEAQYKKAVALHNGRCNAATAPEVSFALCSARRSTMGRP